MNCELTDITVYYQEFGEGRPIIMLNGWGLDHRSMLNDMEPLFEHRDGWKRIYLDLPGHGKTSGKEWITNQDKMLEVLLNFIAKVIPGQRFTVAGASAGAYLARGIVYHKSNLLDGLLLVVPMIVAEDAKRRVPSRITLVEDPALMAELGPDEAEVLNQLAVVQSRKWIDTWRAIAPAADEIGDPEFRAKIGENPENFAFTFDVDALTEPCTAPTLIVTGRQDSSVGYRDAWEILENYPRATFVVLDRAGHGLYIEQEELYHALLNEWLDRVKEYAESQKG